MGYAVLDCVYDNALISNGSTILQHFLHLFQLLCVRSVCRMGFICVQTRL